MLRTRCGPLLHSQRGRSLSLDHEHELSKTAEPIEMGVAAEQQQQQGRPNKVSVRGRRDDMPPLADGSSTVAKTAADLRPSADRSAVRTSLAADSG